MFTSLLSLGFANIAGISLVFLTIFFALRRVIANYRIRNAGGVRAPVLATNPLFGKYGLIQDVIATAALMLLTGLSFFISAGRKQMSNKLLDFYESLFNSAAPECPHCVEISFTGGIRFLMTREPEHIKTVLTSKFTDFGKGPRFHQTWSPFLGDSIFTTDGQLWQNSRGLIRPMFIKDKVRDLEIFDKWAGALVSKLPPQGETVDIMDLLYRMTLDVTTDFLLGASVNSLDK